MRLVVGGLEANMKVKRAISKLKVRANIKAGGLCPLWLCGSNHNRALLEAKVEPSTVT
jgi:hypothetical protein